MAIKENAYAKINVYLNVIKKRKDNYHELSTIMLPLELSDELTFEESDEVELVSNVEINNNAILKTVELFRRTYNINKGVKITLNKRIPIGAGLAGGSADIAATIRGLNKLWNLNYELDEFTEISLKLGSDTLFCLYNKPSYVYGRGDKIVFLDAPPIAEIFLYDSKIEVSTKRVFENHVVKKKNSKLDEKILRSYMNEDYSFFWKKTKNDLEKTTFNLYPELKKITKQLKKTKMFVMMSGSGSVIFLISINENSKRNTQDIKNNKKIITTNIKK